MPSYHVSWEIELDAGSPEEAAAEALSVHRDPGSMATVFIVTAEDGTRYTVDMEEPPEDRVLEYRG